MKTRISRRRRRSSVIAAATGVSALLASLAAGPATAYRSGSPTRALSAQVSLAGLVVDNGAGDAVSLAGDLHVLTQLSGSDDDGWTVDWHASAGQATGIGETTGEYVLNGADSGDDVTVAFPPGPPVRTASFEPTFTLFPPGPPVHPPSPIRLHLSVSFVDSDHGTDVVVHPVEVVPDHD